MIDLSGITTLAEAEAAMQAVAELYQRLQQTAADTDSARRARIGAAVQSLTDLLGPTNPTEAGQGSIREMRLYSDTDLQQHAGLAIRLILEGLEILTATTRDVALVVGEEV